jgi:hypothetical protein
MSRIGKSPLSEAQSKADERFEAEAIQAALHQLASAIAAEPVPEHLNNLAVELGKQLNERSSEMPLRNQDDLRDTQ